MMTIKVRSKRKNGGIIEKDFDTLTKDPSVVKVLVAINH